METFDGFVYDVKIGKKLSEARDDFYFKVAISADIPKERVPAKDEKPEDKARLDKEQQDKVKRLEEKLKTEKAFEKWTYIVSKWSVADAFLKERKDLLAEKKEEPKPADASTPKPADNAPGETPVPKPPEKPADKPAEPAKSGLFQACNPGSRRYTDRQSWRLSAPLPHLRNSADCSIV